MLQPEWTVTVALNYIPKSKMFFQNNNITKMGNNFCVCVCLTLFIKKYIGSVCNARIGGHGSLCLPWEK